MRNWILVLAVVAGCERDVKRAADDAPVTIPPKPTDARTDGPRVYLSTPRGDVAVDVEVVSTEPKIEKGLMYRQHMPPDEGMLFILGVERDWTFWMRNTLIPLDMIFIRKNMTVAGVVENAEPKTDTLRRVNEPSLYVLEVNGGYTRSHGVIKDAKVRFEHVPGF